MKRFGLGLIIGFVVVFGSLYSIALKGNPFDSLTPSSDPTPYQESDEHVSVIKEPSVQHSTRDLTGNKEYKKIESQEASAKKSKPTKAETEKVEIKKRVPSAEQDEMTVALRPASARPKDILIEQKMEVLAANVQKVQEQPKKADGAFSVQVASMPNKADSDSMLQDLKAKGFKGFIQEAKVNDKQYYRVRLGPVASKEEAHELKDSALKVHGISNAIISKE